MVMEPSAAFFNPGCGAADRITVDRIVDQPALGQLVHGPGPEVLCRRDPIRHECERVVVLAAIKEPALIILGNCKIDRHLLHVPEDAHEDTQCAVVVVPVQVLTGAEEQAGIIESG